MADHMRKELVIGALEMAIFRRKSLAVVYHSDQGSQYTSIAFGQRCQSTGTSPYMGSPGNCYDNPMCESFNATLECALLVKHRFRTQREAEAAVFDFIEAWYNPHRRHSSLGSARDRLCETRAESIDLRIPKLRRGSYFQVRAAAYGRKGAVAVVQEAYIQAFRHGR